jgi:hypothetical protein
MSYMQLIAFRNGEAEPDEEYKNSWGGAAMIWNALVRKYQSNFLLGRSPRKICFEEWQDLFDAVKAERLKLHPWEQCVLEWTYDNALVRREHLREIAVALEKFEDAHAIPNQICHLKAAALRMRKLAEDESVEAVGLYAMSVSENPWLEQDGEEERPYSLKTGTRHWFVELEQ